MLTKKLSCGFELPLLAVGTSMMGGEDNGLPDYSRDDFFIKAIQQAIDLGYSHIDTAEVYGGGHTEELVGEAIKGFSRERLFLTSKVAKQNLSYQDVLASARQSLNKLGTDYLDLYLIHAPNPEIPIKITMHALDFLVSRELVRNIGVSNFNAEQIKEAQKYSRYKIVANEVKYNLYARIDVPTIKYCQDNDMIVIAHKPFGRGKLAEEKILLLSELAKKYRKTEAQIILNWLVAKRNVVALFKSTDYEHLRENLDIFDFVLDTGESLNLDALVRK